VLFHLGLAAEAERVALVMVQARAVRAARAPLPALLVVAAAVP
jgi:hypothetical protein